MTTRRRCSTTIPLKRHRVTRFPAGRFGTLGALHVSDVVVSNDFWEHARMHGQTQTVHHLTNGPALGFERRIGRITRMASSVCELPVDPPPLLSVRGLKKYFPIDRRRVIGAARWLRAVDGVDFDLERGTALALVGESGCGKTTVGRAVLRLYRPTAGQVSLDGVDLTRLSGRRLKAARRRMQIVFQDPNGSLDPRMRVGASIAEPMRVHRWGDRRAVRRRVGELLEAVGLAPVMADRYPHEFSGGQRQRIGIARAMSLDPDLVVADEPTSALDVSVRVQVLNLLADLQQRTGVAYLLISHDLPMVYHYSDRVQVMFAGRIVEAASTEALFASPRHPYTRMLLDSVPKPDPSERAEETDGNPTSDDAPAEVGCGFAPRCRLAVEQCRHVAPALTPLSTNPLHHVACHLASDIGPPESEDDAR